ncbi:MAG: outer membrane lipid asymmetry maintenance protein MlaD [Gammaproteobacteria bacterium]|nr:outer membrane lipid asymmetry maintenance protein MlaD [Gammaproteobacteria bacterium]
MQTRMVEIWVGLFVAAGLAALLMLSLQVSNLSSMSGDDGYTIKARFDNIGGLKVRSAVKMGGVLIGRVASIDLDPVTFEAVVSMTMDPRFNQLPQDSSASIFTAGLLGEQYVGIEPGGADEVLKDGDTLLLSQSALVLEQLIGQFLFSQGSKDKNAGE